MKKINFLLNFAYFAYIKIANTLYRIIMWLSVRNPAYTGLLKDISEHNKDTIMNSTYIHKFDYQIYKYIPTKMVHILVFSDGVRADVLYFLRLYKTIIEIPEFIELGEVKIVIITTYGGEIFTLATSLVITPKTTPQEFILHFFSSFVKLAVKSYDIESFDIIMVKAITGRKLNMDDVMSSYKDSHSRDVIITNQSISHLNVKSNGHPSQSVRKYSTSTKTVMPGDSGTVLDDFLPIDLKKDPRRFILPLHPKDKQMKKIAVFDIETFVHDNKLYPYAIGLQYTKYNKARKVIFYYENSYSSIELNSKALLEKMINHMVENCKSYTIFAHNLGKFDAIFMISSLYNVLGPYSLMFGKDNRIITISFKGVKMLDSLRIFPMSLKELGKQFNVETQKGEFDHDKVNKDNVTTDIIKSEVLHYLEGDISCLYECMMKASDHVFEKYHINVTDVYSASSLAMKHYRTSYIGIEGIPLLPRPIIPIISEAYFGGISQVYKTRGENLYYYDINSLYPWAMTHDMPYEYLGESFKPKLEDVFGFVYASVYVPKDMKFKVLPMRMDDNLATPSGNLLGVYFSEELKYAKSMGCTVDVHKAYIFTKKKLFVDYVNDLYAEKAVATGSSRVFIKLLLNGLYGFFARTDDKFIALHLPINEAITQAQIYPSYNLIAMDDNETAILIRETQPSKEWCDSTSHEFLKYLKPNNTNRSKSNRAIAAAITAYSRIRIHQFKVICDDVYYSDTDSIITTTKLDDKYLNNELGFMKDEMKGVMIKQGIFVSPKLYGLLLENGKEIIKARGVPSDILNMDHLDRILKGEEISYTRRQLIRSIEFLSIHDKIINGSVKLNIPSGKTPVYNDDNCLIGYNDIHNTIFKAINNNPLRTIVPRSIRRFLDKIKYYSSHKIW